jgi:hypothetical protein
VGERLRAASGDLVVPARRAFLAQGGGLRLPPGPDIAVALEPAEDGVDGAARKTGRVHDVEAVADPPRDGVEDGDRAQRQRFGRFRRLALHVPSLPM